jgi:hypothetical protein
MKALRIIGLVLAVGCAAALAQPPVNFADWTPRPAEGKAEAWEKAVEKDWVDARFRSMDTGPTFDATFAIRDGLRRQLVYKGTAIRVGEHGEGAWLFDRCQMRWAAGWTGDFLKHSDRRFGLLNTPEPAGVLTLLTASGPGWADAEGNWTTDTPPTIPLPNKWAKFHGMYLKGKRAEVAYSVGGVQILDTPWAETDNGHIGLTRSLVVGPSSRPLKCFIATVDGKEMEGLGLGRWHVLNLPRPDRIVQNFRVYGDPRAVSIQREADRLILVVEPHDQPVACKLVSWISPPQRPLQPYFPSFQTKVDLASIRKLTVPGPSRWGEPVVTTGEVAPDNTPFVIDTLAVPYDNPHKALFFLTGVDTLPNGDLAVCTCHGDVWIVGGIDASLKKLTWKRFATGLYQPLGLKVVDGKIVVLERGQLTRLHDLNGDGEADFYENLCSNWHTGPGEHSFDTCLEVDPSGNFWFFKTGDTNLPHGGCLLRVPKDGGTVEVMATGFRHPIGLGMSPTGFLTGADQEGNWMPATRIDQYRHGGFYGDMRAHHRTAPPPTFDPPLCWLPREIDNSAGGQVWVPDGLFGPLGGRPLHLSYGRCKAMLLMRQELPDGTVQGGATDLGWNFLSGVKTGCFHPTDGHLYVVGLNGWQTAAKRDGCLQRVRYTGRPVVTPLSVEAFAGSLRLTFSQPLDAKQADDVSNYRIERWSYHWSGEYGSKRYLPDRPGAVGQEAVAVTSAKVTDEKTVVLTVPLLKPVMQMELSFKLTTATGAPCTGVVYHTINQLPPIETIK